jgi:hypothetical protein
VYVLGEAPLNATAFSRKISSTVNALPDTRWQSGQ